MTTVFIGGSRAVSRLSPAVQARLEDLIQRGDTILIGDANGADKAVQQYLARRGYQNVVVFCMETCRNNVGTWPLKTLEPSSGRRDFAYYATKDIAMAGEAKCGLMLWDGKSKGTLHNMLNLLQAGKRTLVYFGPTKDFHVLSSKEDLQRLLSRCNKADLGRAERALGAKMSLSQSQLPSLR